MDARRKVTQRLRASQARKKALPEPVRSSAPAATFPPADASFIRDSYAATAFADVVDRAVHAGTARFTGGLSPIALSDAYMDWASHLAFSPGKRMQLTEKAMRKWIRFANHAARSVSNPDIEPASRRCHRISVSLTRLGSRFHSI